jgi:hypothetical protein
MPKPSESEHYYRLTRQRIIGLGERTVRKSYYPQLQPSRNWNAFASCWIRPVI